MKLTPNQIKRMVKIIFRDLKEGSLVEFKESEDKVFRRGQQLVEEEMEKERQLDLEVNDMMDNLERTQPPGSFERYKMFPLLKKKLAKDKGIIL